MYSSDVAIRAIAHSLGMNPITARKYIHLDAPPVKEELGRKILLSADYLQSRIKENPNIGVIHLWREIKKKRTLRSMINRL